jgi:hypothetical protein
MKNQTTVTRTLDAVAPSMVFHKKVLLLNKLGVLGKEENYFKLRPTAGYGKCSSCSCPGFSGSGYTCTRGGCGHHYDSHW